MSPIKTHRDGAILQVTLDRPKANAIDLATSKIMGDVFEDFRDDPDLRVAIVTGGGQKFFCPGWDLKAAADGDAGGTASITRATVLFRIVKLLRMLKLARIFRASRVFERTVLDVALHHLEWTYAVLKLLKFFLWLVIFAHFQACVWGLVSSFLPPPTWISEFEIEYMESEGEGERLPSGLEVYAAALYWSVMTLTSIGYGATP